ncbi:alpha/beta fold hydrolase [Herbaspirillum seropedicae]|uniref:Esterase protein n=1 Tax=Herbaspirillum seropedicae (strain SmR1) TaxID=757424 RepID=D8IX47_HERSS|nr:YqiA/YcfP family alpha/beta fold hydrolase [Herbaspirillum seropedicae]ADJ61922.1 esterase protein [Herbaspirillum seropedicae SmR1]AKN64107.1 esterase [Herbaspirillum seropedicae]AON52700.1 esterase [Herbaspirillum seropedicae]NQE29493.1 esterase [Herbaspirillum seropedicae]UMU20016.1 alpha/beta fold hydrolase [Herbaspirillum seropedicae]
MILYLHGFRSSPQSYKARLMGQRMADLGLQEHYLCPQLPASPAAAIALAGALVAQVEPAQLTVVGSSLGGFYATWLAERLGCRAVLLNPAVKPPRDLESYVGVSTQYHSDEPFEFKHEYIAELQALVVPAITRPERYFLIAATGDEVLDWREMVAHYPLARQTVIQGSDHGIAEFADYLDEVLAFCGVDPHRKAVS